LILTGLSGSGKGTVLKALEDAGYYSVDNLPLDLLPKFAELTRDSPKIRRAALVVDVREGGALRRFPALYRKVRQAISTMLVFLEAEETALVRRFSETRRPHPLGGAHPVVENIREEKRQLAPIRKLADHVIDTSRFNVHELRELIKQKFRGDGGQGPILVYVNSFGFRNGVPAESDLVFDVRFLPNPNYIPEFKPLSGRHPRVARYIRSFPQTVEFVDKISELLIYLLPHYIREGKSYLTISFGCTGGRHRSVLIAAEIGRRLAKASFKVKVTHRDIEKGG
jgi:RNase adapter protein RapZ